MTLYNPSPGLEDPAEPGPVATGSPFLDPGVPSVAVVIQRIGEDKELSAQRRAALASALRRRAYSASLRMLASRFADRPVPAGVSRATRLR